MQKNNKQIILFTYGAIGDFLMLLSACEALHTTAPERPILVLTTRSTKILTELAERYPYVVVRNAKKSATLLRLFKTSFRRTSVLLPPTFGTAPPHFKILGWLVSRMPGSTFIGFQDKGATWMFTTTLPYDTSIPYYETLTGAVQRIEPRLVTSVPHFSFTPEPNVLDQYQLTKGAYIVVHPFASNEKRGLPPARWEELFMHLAKRFTPDQILISGSGADLDEAVRLARTHATVIAGKVTLHELATLINASALFIGVDTGITHLACMLHARSVVLGNQSNPSWLPYYNERARILFDTASCTHARGDKSGDCTVMVDGHPYFKCLYNVPAKRITDAIDELLLNTSH